jgi:hypothetical protein
MMESYLINNIAVIAPSTAFVTVLVAVVVVVVVVHDGA